MTEPQFEEAQPQPVEEVEPARNRRGRPRAQSTLARDEAVLRALADGVPKTRTELAEQLNDKPSLVYLALWRLMREDPPRVERSDDPGTRNAWRLTS